FGVQRTEVGPAQTEIERQIGAEFQIVLDEETQDVFTLILASRGRESGYGIEPTAFVVRHVIEEVPHIKEIVAWHAAAGAVLQVMQPRGLTAKLDRVPPVDFGGDVFVAVGPLIQDATDIRPKRIRRDA